MRKPHSATLRKGRISLAGQIYVLTAVTYGRKPHFAEFWAGRVVVNAMRHHAKRGDVESLAFVIMPDHLHWLISLPGSLEQSELMRSVKGFSSRCLHGYRGRNAAPTRGAIVGAAGRDAVVQPDHLVHDQEPIWQDGFHDHALRRDEDLQKVARYIVMNPVRSKMVTSIWEYPLWDAVWVEEE